MITVKYDTTTVAGVTISYRGVIHNWNGTKPDAYRSKDCTTKEEASKEVMAICERAIIYRKLKEITLALSKNFKYSDLTK